MSSYRQDLQQAWARVRAVPTQLLETLDGTVEYADSGAGQPVLLSHGILGSHVEGLGMVGTYVGDDVRAIAPSRFGYFGSEVPADGTPARQADVYAALLDHLGVDRAVVVGYSAGGPSAIQFGLRHPDRVSALVLASSALPPSSRPPAVARSRQPRALRTRHRSGTEDPRRGVRVDRVRRSPLPGSRSACTRRDPFLPVELVSGSRPGVR